MSFSTFYNFIRAMGNRGVEKIGSALKDGIQSLQTRDVRSVDDALRLHKREMTGDSPFRQASSRMPISLFAPSIREPFQPNSAFDSGYVPTNNWGENITDFHKVVVPKPKPPRKEKPGELRVSDFTKVRKTKPQTGGIKPQSTRRGKTKRNYKVVI